jgi:hypothetical protein
MALSQDDMTKTNTSDHYGFLREHNTTLSAAVKRMHEHDCMLLSAEEEAAYRVHNGLRAAGYRALTRTWVAYFRDQGDVYAAASSFLENNPLLEQTRHHRTRYLMQSEPIRALLDNAAPLRVPDDGTVIVELAEYQAEPLLQELLGTSVGTYGQFIRKAGAKHKQFVAAHLLSHMDFDRLAVPPDMVEVRGVSLGAYTHSADELKLYATATFTDTGRARARFSEGSTPVEKEDPIESALRMYA